MVKPNTISNITNRKLGVQKNNLFRTTISITFTTFNKTTIQVSSRLKHVAYQEYDNDTKSENLILF